LADPHRFDLCVLAYWLSLPVWAVVCLQLTFFVWTARTLPHTSALALAPHGRDAGAASAMMGSLQSFIATFAGMAVAVFNDGTLSTLAILMIGGAALAALSYFWVRNKAVIA